MHLTGAPLSSSPAHAKTTTVPGDEGALTSMADWVELWPAKEPGSQKLPSGLISAPVDTRGQMMSAALACIKVYSKSTVTGVEPWFFSVKAKATAWPPCTEVTPATTEPLIDNGFLTEWGLAWAAAGTAKTPATIESPATITTILRILMSHLRTRATCARHPPNVRHRLEGYTTTRSPLLVHVTPRQNASQLVSSILVTSDGYRIDDRWTTPRTGPRLPTAGVAAQDLTQGNHCGPRAPEIRKRENSPRRLKTTSRPSRLCMRRSGAATSI